jgi:hypothetical protein
LLKKWLVEYKFKDWETHQTNPDKIGQQVMPEEKRQRAEEIANDLGSNKLWHSHGRMISATTLQKVLRLKIEDYSRDETLRDLIRSYNDLTTEYIAKTGQPFYFHSKYFF